MAALLPSEIAWYVTGRFYRRADGALADYGYFIHLAGVESEMFNGEAGERTAHFSFAAKPFHAGAIVNGSLSLATDPAGEFSVYLQRTPAGDFDHPESFASGECIATFRRTSVVMGTTVSAAGSSGSEALFGGNVFSARLVRSAPFELRGKGYDLAQIVGVGITQFGTSSEIAISPPPQGYTAVAPFSGSAIALGR